VLAFWIVGALRSVRDPVFTAWVNQGLDPATRARVEQFTRIESFGSPLVDWIKVTLDPDQPKLMSIRTGKPLNPGQQF